MINLFKLIALFVLCFLGQSAMVLAEVVELDALGSPAELSDAQIAPQLSRHTTGRALKSRVHYAASDPTNKTTMNTYRLDAGDKIHIEVFGQDDLSFSARLDESGVINYPFLGEISAVGVSTSELASSIASGLRNGYLTSPNVNVSILEYRPFYIKGQVAKAGPYPYQPGLTLAKAVAIAGGFSEFASVGDVFVVREKDRSHKMRKIHASDVIYPGDTITVNERMFYIDGEVKTPGKYPLRIGLTLRDAITLAGGMTEFASTDKIFMTTSKDRSMAVQLDSEIPSGASIFVQQGFFYIDGAVNHAGKYPLRSGLTVREAISLAGGLSDHASIDKIYVKRVSGVLRSIAQDDKVPSGSSIIVQQGFF